MVYHLDQLLVVGHQGTVDSDRIYALLKSIGIVNRRFCKKLFLTKEKQSIQTIASAILVTQ